MIFDIMLSGVSDGTVMHHTSVAPVKSIKPCSLKVPGTTLSNEMYQPCQLCILNENEIQTSRYKIISFLLFLYVIYFLNAFY